MEKKLCPQCGAPLEQHRGVIEETVYRFMNQSRRGRRNGKFVACMVCEYCEEV